MSKLSHLDDEGRASMVDVSSKDATERDARAVAVVVMSETAYALVVSGDNPKGDVMAAARIAGIMAAKKTSELIPLCHPLALTHAGVEFTLLPERHSLRIEASAKTTGPTGVEMEALTAASVAALTVYDMIKAVDREARIENLRLLAKSGGKSGSFEAKTEAASSRAASPLRSRGKAAARVLMHEVAAPRTAAAASQAAPSEREALRAFMTAHRLRASEWAKSAEVPVNELYGFLNGNARALAPATLERLARAARASVDDMLGRNRKTR